MKLAVLSDIHGNLPALQTVLDDMDAWGPDQVVVNGDVVNRGPKSAECWQIIADRMQSQGWLMTRGNHEEYTVGWAEPRPGLSDAELDMFQSSRWTYQQLPSTAIDTLKALPDSHQMTLHGSTIRFNHASPRGTQDGIGPWNSDAEIREKMAPAPDIFFTAHTHRTFVRQVDQTQVVNSGSVGVPLDGDPRASYIRMSWQDGWHIEPVRLAYDREQTQRDFDATAYCDVCGSTGVLLYLEWRDARSYVPMWGRTYGERIQLGQMMPKQAVAEYLASHDLP